MTHFFNKSRELPSGSASGGDFSPKKRPVIFLKVPADLRATAELQLSALKEILAAEISDPSWYNVLREFV